MRIVTRVAAMQRLALRWRRAGTRVTFVPTMGFLHEGHLSLIRQARRLAGRSGRVVVSIFVNPTQFGPNEDFANYPRDLKRDKELCRAAGVDVMFSPAKGEMYPGKDADEFSTCVVEEKLSQVMEGTSRPTHFRGVTTVVAKLFNLVLPDVAVFGAKDWQQVAVVKRMVRDLNFPVRIAVGPTRRQADGLAMSSRNNCLSAAERSQAAVLYQAIRQARQTVRENRVGIPASRLRAQLKWLIETCPTARVDYIEFFDPGTLRPVAEVHRGTHMSLAVFVGRTRLIDNGRL